MGECCELTESDDFPLLIYRDVVSGWAGWALAHPEFGVSVNPLTTRGPIGGRGVDYAHPITTCPPKYLLYVLKMSLQLSR